MGQGLAGSWDHMGISSLVVVARQPAAFPFTVYAHSHIVCELRPVIGWGLQARPQLFWQVVVLVLCWC